MNHKTDMREALQLCIDAMLHDGVPTDPEHPKRIALNAAEAALASRPDAQRCDGSGAVPISTDDYAECKVCGGSGCKSVPHRWDDEGDRYVKCGDKDWMADASCSERLLKRTSRPDAQESLASENVAKDSPPKVSQGPAQADEREAFAMWWKDISPSNFDYASALAGYLAAVDPTVAHAAAPQAEAAQGVPEDVIDAVSKALRLAWQLGQTYWQQADSDSYKQQDKSDETQKKFEKLVDETRSMLAAAPLPGSRAGGRGGRLLRHAELLLKRSSLHSKGR